METHGGKQLLGRDQRGGPARRIGEGIGPAKRQGIGPAKRQDNASEADQRGILSLDRFG